jgi:glucose/mannose-6-phosphate isomerase
MPAARIAASPRAVITTGGRLAEMAREDGVPVIGVPSGMQPRAAVVYMMVGALAAAAVLLLLLTWPSGWAMVHHRPHREEDDEEALKMPEHPEED